ncbi:MAG: histone [Methanobacteriota archaeon]
MTQLPYATVKRIMKNAGAQRVSKDAVYELIGLMEAYAEKVASTAVSIAENAGGRNTVMKDDVKISAEEIHGVISL